MAARHVSINQNIPHDSVVPHVHIPLNLYIKFLSLSAVSVAKYIVYDFIRMSFFLVQVVFLLFGRVVFWMHHFEEKGGGEGACGGTGKVHPGEVEIALVGQEASP